MIDLEQVRTATPSTHEVSWTSRDVLLYQLSLGASEPRYTYERGLSVLPTFAMVAGQGISAGDRPARGLDLPGIEIDLSRILHSGQALEVHRPLPTAGTAAVTARVAEVWDKGKAAVVVLESSAADDDGLLWTSRMQIWARGEGGFGGMPGPDLRWAAPDRSPDLVLDSRTTPDQALLYRLNGDLNPLHVDPTFAKRFGFDRPILHGLASYGIVAKAIVDGVLGGDPSRLVSLDVRFAGTLFPGETIRTSVWREGTRLTLAATCPERDHAPVLSHGSAEVTP